MIYLNFHFMGNIMFGFLPSQEEIVERGYKRLLEMLSRYPEVRSHLYASSHTGEILKEKYPEAFQTILKAVDDGRLKIEFNGYEHAPFNCLSPDSVNKQVEKGLIKDHEIWGQWGEKPGGYWPSDCCWDPYVGYLLKSRGFKWAYFGSEHFKQSNPGGKYYPDWRNLDLYRPLSVRCPMNVKINGLCYSNPNYDLFRPEQMEAFFSQLEQLRLERKEDGYVSIGLDFETLLVLEVKGICPDGAQVFADFLERLRSAENIRHEFSDTILEIIPPKQETFVRQNYWGYYGGAYPDGAQRILSLCDTAERDLLMCENLLGLMDSKADSVKMGEEIEVIWQYLLEAENSEVRFTNPSLDEKAHVFYPKEHVVVETLEHAIKAFESARKLKQRLFVMYRTCSMRKSNRRINP